MDIRTALSFDLERIAEIYVKNHTETYRGLLSDDYFESLTLDYAKKMGHISFQYGQKNMGSI